MSAAKDQNYVNMSRIALGNKVKTKNRQNTLQYLEYFVILYNTRNLENTQHTKSDWCEIKVKIPRSGTRTYGTNYN